MQTTMTRSFAAVPAAIVGRARKLANNTFAYTTQDGRNVVRLHMTDIFEQLPDGRLRITSGGYKTVTTKARLNDQMRKHGYGVVSGYGSWAVVDGKGGNVPFFDGMVLPDAFSGRGLAKAQKIGERETKLKADIKSFVLKTLPSDKPMPQPDNGDCWYCWMFDKVEPVTKQGFVGPSADKPARVLDNDHLIEHIEEGYMHGSLIVNAMRDAGFQDVGISIICYSSRPDYNRVRKTVRRYLQKRLGLTY